MVIHIVPMCTSEIWDLWLRDSFGLWPQATMVDSGCKIDSHWVQEYCFQMPQQNKYSLRIKITVLYWPRGQKRSIKSFNSSSPTVDNFGGKPLDLTIYVIINKTCTALRPHKYMSGPLGPQRLHKIYFCLTAKRLTLLSLSHPHLYHLIAHDQLR